MELPKSLILQDSLIQQVDCRWEHADHGNFINYEYTNKNVCPLRNIVRRNLLYYVSHVVYNIDYES